MAKPPHTKLGRMIRSGMRRYPRHLTRSIVEPAGGGPLITERPPAETPPDERFDEPGPVGVCWLGHATVLLRLAGRWILTDPVFSGRIGPRLGQRTIGVARQRPAPVRIDRLPHIDLVLISHAHFDHLDRPSLARLADGRTTVVTAARTGDLIPPGFGEVVELGPGLHWRARGLRVTAFEPAHWGSRFALDTWRGCNAYLLESDEGRYFYAGDTAETRAFEQAGRVDLGVFGVGAYEPWEHAHATPEQVWRMVNGMQAERLLPVHHSTFELSDEPADEPMARLYDAAGRETDRIVDPPPGELWAPGR